MLIPWRRLVDHPETSSLLLPPNQRPFGRDCTQLLAFPVLLRLSEDLPYGVGWECYFPFRLSAAALSIRRN